MVMHSRSFALLRTLVFASLFLWLWLWLIPRWIAASKHVALVPERPWAWIVVAIGGAIMLRCALAFAWTGRGTPAPFDPPRRLVITGLYRYVRNPMYVGMGIALAGEALLLPAITRELLLVAACAWAAVTLFIVAYEEPALRAAFGQEYVAYTRAVRRWIPRLRPYAPELDNA
jgi:protein-S-isoprenylcysteine O-methyltransferase Ste14